MCIIKKVFYYEESELPVIKYMDGIWFRGKTIAEILKYTNQRKAFRDHVDPEDRVRFNELHGRTNRSPPKKDTRISKGTKRSPWKGTRKTQCISTSLEYTV